MEEQMRKEREQQDRENAKKKRGKCVKCSGKQRKCRKNIGVQLREWQGNLRKKINELKKKMWYKEDLRREKEAARQRAANERATAWKLARESMDLINDEWLELMEAAASAKGRSSIFLLYSEALQELESYKDTMGKFPATSVKMKRPFVVRPWTDSEQNVRNLFRVWRFIVTFADVLGLWPFTLFGNQWQSTVLGLLKTETLHSSLNGSRPTQTSTHCFNQNKDQYWQKVPEYRHVCSPYRSFPFTGMQYINHINNDINQ